MQGSMEDSITVQYMRDTAEQAGFRTIFMDMADIGWDSENGLWADLEEQEIKNIFKLYPWEWLTSDSEKFSQHLLVNDRTCWIEPPFKMLLSNKGILPILWELYPNHKNLLPAFFDDDIKRATIKNNCAIKPILGREGANITLRGPRVDVSTDGSYDGRSIYQELCPLPEFGGNYPVIGSWIIGQQPAGIGIRESDSLITTNRSRFIPHLFE
jgi:glutathionylspermidine synthase